MLHGMTSAMRAILWAAFLIGVVIVLWSIVAVELIHPLNKQIGASGVYDECARCPEAYSSVGNACLTFVASILAGDSWGKVSMPIMETFPLSIPFFIAVRELRKLGRRTNNRSAVKNSFSYKSAKAGYRNCFSHWT